MSKGGSWTSCERPAGPSEEFDAAVTRRLKRVVHVPKVVPAQGNRTESKLPYADSEQGFARGEQPHPGKKAESESRYDLRHNPEDVLSHKKAPEVTKSRAHTSPWWLHDAEQLSAKRGQDKTRHDGSAISTMTDNLNESGLHTFSRTALH